MKQFQFEYKNINNFRRELARVKRFCDVMPHKSIFFQVFTQRTDFSEIEELTRLITDDFPTADYYGCQSYGNIIDGKLSKFDTLIVCSVFEYRSTKTEIIYIDPQNPNAKFKSLDDLWNYCNTLDWLKAIEFTFTYEGAALLKVGQEPISLKENVQVFGGIAIYPKDLVTEQSFLFTKDFGFSDKAAVAILLGGPDLNIATSYYNGFEGLGKHFTITKSSGKIISEIDHQPAINVYKNYLGIDYGKTFLKDTMKFPLLVNTHGVECIRLPMPSKNEDELVLTVDVPEGSHLRLSYGEPSTIISTINNHVKEIFDFAPETIRIYSCAIRRTFWGDNRVSLETNMLDAIASTVGFYTRGEILRVGNYLQYFNATIVACLVREGEAVKPNYLLDNLLEESETFNDNSVKLIHYLEEITNEVESQFYRTFASLSLAYKTLFSIDLKENKITQFDKHSDIADDLEKAEGAILQMEYFVKNHVVESYQEKAFEFCNLKTISERLKNTTHIETELIGKTVGWFRAQFIVVSKDENNNVVEVLYTTQVIDDDKKKEENLIHLAGTDELTGLYNRRTYENDISEFRKNGFDENLVYISIDVNGLKKANDTIGHDAGDELIQATAECLRNTFSPYGKNYRIGGDEFVAIIFASQKMLESLKEKFLQSVNNWKGKLVEHLSLATGYVCKEEIKNRTIDEIEKLADKAMYNAKHEYYLKSGENRRRGD